ncbi:MAG: hypothetical protein Ct9H90mP11_03750 [Acidimicrobiales bacterium]|nr:MAG: hypothetical protein Ct9H90mP11_03750 [Acidimicrobiales bacterium]
MQNVFAFPHLSYTSSKVLSGDTSIFSGDLAGNQVFFISFSCEEGLSHEGILGQFPKQKEATMPALNCCERIFQCVILFDAETLPQGIIADWIVILEK